MTFDTPILLVAWRRPDKVAKVIKSMRVIKPQNIYVACDGPIQNNPKELDKVLKTRMVIDKEIDWNWFGFVSSFTLSAGDFSQHRSNYKKSLDEIIHPRLFFI